MKMTYEEAKAVARTMGYMILCHNMTGEYTALPYCLFGWRVVSL